MEQVNKILEQKAIRITPMRQLVLEYFLQNDGTFGLIELEVVFPKSDRITIYRTLKTFEERGILHSIKEEGMEAKYALCKEHCSSIHHLDQHPHFYCERCKQVTCMNSQLIPTMELPNGYTQNEVTMMIKGICPNCQR